MENNSPNKEVQNTNLNGNATNTQGKSKEKQITVKLMIIGDQAVGKSSLTARYTEEVFYPNIIGTAGMNLDRKILKINEDTLRIMIYDTAGHDRFRQIVTSHYKGANGVVLVYDVTDQKTFSSVTEWMAHINNNADKNVKILLVGNKVDLENREVTFEQGKELAMKFGVDFMETSAYSGYNVNEAFEILVKKIYFSDLKQDKNTNIPPNTNSNGNEQNKQLVTEPMDMKKDKNNKCCSLL
jgi:Ras-related protein Rab-8A